MESKLTTQYTRSKFYFEIFLIFILAHISLMMSEVWASYLTLILFTTRIS